MTSNSLFAFVLGGALVATVFTAAVPPQQEQEMPPEMKAMFEQAKKYTEPGAAHASLAAYLGTWDCVTSMSIDPSAPPMTSKSKAEITWLIEGRWIQENRKGTLFGRPYQGFGMTGYDNFKQAYLSSFIDNFNTYKLDSQGKLAQDGKTAIFYGTLDEYLTGENDKMVKYIYRWKDADHFTLEVHDLAIGETNTKVFECSYSRAK